jgi:HK97 gp10 family phage protein
VGRSVYRHFTGVDALSGFFQQLPVDLRERILKDAVASAAKLIKQAAKRHARRSVRTGALHASIDVKVVGYKGHQQAAATAIIGVRRDYYRRGGKVVAKGEDRRGAEQPARYAHLVEFGHMVRARGKSGHKPGKGKAAEPKQGALRWVAPRPFIRPAIMETRGQVQRILLEKINDGIGRARDRMIKRGEHAA